MLVRGLEAGQSPVTAAAAMNPGELPGRLPAAGWTSAVSAGEFGFPGPGAGQGIGISSWKSVWGGANTQREQVPEMPLPAGSHGFAGVHPVLCGLSRRSAPRPAGSGAGAAPGRNRPEPSPAPGQAEPGSGEVFMAAASSMLLADSPTCLCANFRQAHQVTIMAPGCQRGWEGSGRRKRRRKRERAAKESRATRKDGVCGAHGSPRSWHEEPGP